ncbi:hypothetical protein G6011_08469 [Alternaria panax]|uniref:BTB domain-containing protein n=1 Tax=Alternaria panax TaxID=48097 RepID=A0AAD4FKT9_9PLEO|nr:hypothetical protein G6011_08469 [Alternaria panax]
MVEASHLQVVGAVKSCLFSGGYSDLTIRCGEDVYKVHKTIVCTPTGFFARATKFGDKKSQTDVNDLPDDETRVIASLIQYLYSSEYDGELRGTLNAENAKPLESS